MTAAPPSNLPSKAKSCHSECNEESQKNNSNSLLKLL